MIALKKRLVLPVLAALILVPMISISARASDKSFSTVVKHIQAAYKGKRQGTFGMITFARFLVKVIRPAGVKNFKVVMFKEVDFSRFPGEVEFHKFMNDTVHPSWQPLAQISSRRNKQWVYVYFQEENEHAKFLVVAMESKQAFVVQFKFDPEKLARFMEDPKIMGISLVGKKEKDRQSHEQHEEGDKPESNSDNTVEKTDKKIPPLF
ncbi:MAG: hypothetical protein L0229_17075 [Blastocatellia bacterium]|nr:hypothetical protein [Blastocatellia bacterium]